MITWDQSLSVGVQFIDDQHKEWFRRTNDFTRAVREGNAKHAILETLQAMADYTETHFADEEKFMEDINYPLRDGHVALHDEFKDKYVSLLLKLLKEDKSIYSETEGYLENWLVTHISKADKAYGDYYANSNAGHGLPQDETGGQEG